MRGVLFDLDGTLLDLDLDVFLERYFAALGRVCAATFPGVDALEALGMAVRAMQRPHPGRTNREVFDDEFERLTGIAITEHWGAFEAFYRDVFPTLGDGARAHAGAREAVEAARARGLRVALATQPIFPVAAVTHRLAWAGLTPDLFDAITTYETLHACKPQAAYFTETAALIGCDPAACLMVGDDRLLDLPASDTGMRTFYVGSAASTSADYTGTLRDLPSLLDRLTGPGVDLG